MEARIEDAAARFWADAGAEEPFPRSLETSIAFSLPILIGRMPRLGVFSAEQELRRLVGGAAPTHLRIANGPDRRLRACMVAAAGNAVILLDAADDPDEQRFSLAHELAHFLLDYWQPRARIAQRLGQHGQQVFDGLRTASSTDRIDATLAGVRLDVAVHLMQRGVDGIVDAAVAEAERRADLLAFELLAPEATAVALLAAEGTHAERIAQSAEAMHRVFGLPYAASELYARRLLHDRVPQGRWRAWLS